MKTEEIKQKAVELAKEFTNDKNYMFKLNEQTMTPQEWYILVRLAQVYYNVMQNIYTREQAVQEQKQIFEFVRDNYNIFKGLDGEDCG